MFQLTNNNLIALFHHRIAKTACQHIDTICCAFRENYLLFRLRMKQFRHFLACFLVLLRRHLTQVVHPAMHIRIPLAICLCYSIYHHLRLLCRLAATGEVGETFELDEEFDLSGLDEE